MAHEVVETSRDKAPVAAVAPRSGLSDAHFWTVSVTVTTRVGTVVISHLVGHDVRFIVGRSR